MKPLQGKARIAQAAAWLLVMALPSFSGEAKPRPEIAGTVVGKYALLIGCTKYQAREAIVELKGPANDVALMARMLKEDFAFPAGHIRQLVGWPEDAKARPTYANIVAAFDQLVAKAGPDTQIVVFFAGHGIQVPIPTTQEDPLDPANPEPDGMDEVFLPADVQLWTKKEGLKNALLDDQIGRWLEQLRHKGAAVWAIFDCCHSGGMDRGPDDVEHARGLHPHQLGIPADLIADAVQRARQAVLRAGGIPFEQSPLEMAPRPKGKGSVVAFYAAQPFEKAPELPRPEGAPRTRENYFGLLTYTLIQALKQTQRPLSYRELAQNLAARYRATRGPLPPTPCCEGDLDREVLGLRRWPKGADIFLERSNGRLRINAGELHGLAPGSILAVHPPAGDARDPGAVLGYIQVVHSSAVAAGVEPCVFQADKPAVAAAKLPELGRCRLLLRTVGDMRVQLAVDPPRAGQGQLAENLHAALGHLSKEIQPLLTLSKDRTNAPWLLYPVTDEEAKTYRIPPNRIVLIQGEGRHPSGKPNLPRVAKALGVYTASDAKELAGQLERDVQRIFTWQNLWRLAGGFGNQAAPAPHGLKLEVIKLKGKNEPDRPVVHGETLFTGQRIELRLGNEGNRNYWLALLLMDPGLGVKVHSLALEAGQSLPPLRATITGSVAGADGIIVLAVDMNEYKQQPRFDFLEQEGLGRPGRFRGSADFRPATPLDKLLAAAAFGKGTRSLPVEGPANPVILSWSWFTLPAQAPPKK